MSYIPDNDLNKFFRLLVKMAKKHKFKINKIGKVDNIPLLLLTKVHEIHAPYLLFGSGFHGDEIGGCWGVVRFLENYSRVNIGKINIAFLPLINPTGFKYSSRLNIFGQNPNAGFCHTNTSNRTLSVEGKILLSHIDEIKYLSRDGFVSLHEDCDRNSFYLYSFENSERPGIYSEILREELYRHFTQTPDGLYDGEKIVNGIIFNHCDGSFEDFLFHEGIKFTACTETPGLIDIEQRIEANYAVIQKMIKSISF